MPDGGKGSGASRQDGEQGASADCRLRGEERACAFKKAVAGRDGEGMCSGQRGRELCWENGQEAEHKGERERGVGVKEQGGQNRSTFSLVSSLFFLLSALSLSFLSLSLSFCPPARLAVCSGAGREARGAERCEERGAREEPSPAGRRMSDGNGKTEGEGGEGAGRDGGKCVCVRARVCVCVCVCVCELKKERKRERERKRQRPGFFFVVFVSLFLSLSLSLSLSLCVLCIDCRANSAFPLSVCCCKTQSSSVEGERGHCGPSFLSCLSLSFLRCVCVCGTCVLHRKKGLLGGRSLVWCGRERDGAGETRAGVDG